MNLTQLKGNLKLMHSPETTLCEFSKDRIDSGEIALSIKSYKSTRNNIWVKLDHISNLSSALSRIYDNPEKANNYETIEIDSDLIFEGKSCRICDGFYSENSKAVRLGRQFKKESFHYSCLPEVSTELNRISEVIDTQEVLANRI